MKKDSNELLDIALRKVEEAVKSNLLTVEIMIRECFSGSSEEMKKICEQLELKTITELLREEFSEYEIKSIIRQRNRIGIISTQNAPCSMFYALV